MTYLGLERCFKGLSTDCSSTGHTFDSQHINSDSQPSITPDPGDLTPSSGLNEHQASMWQHKHTCRENTHKQNNKKKNKYLSNLIKQEKC